MVITTPLSNTAKHICDAQLLSCPHDVDQHICVTHCYFAVWLASYACSSLPLQIAAKNDIVLLCFNHYNSNTVVSCIPSCNSAVTMLWGRKNRFAIARRPSWCQVDTMVQGQAFFSPVEIFVWVVLSFCLCLALPPLASSVARLFSSLLVIAIPHHFTHWQC